MDAIIAKLRGSVPNPGINPGGSGGGGFVPGSGASPADKDKIKDNKDKSDKNDRKDLVKADVTQARDIERIGWYYDVVKIQPVDMFPHTHHVENVALLRKKNA